MPSENGLIPLYNNTRISRSLFCLNQEVEEEMDEEGNMISIFPKLIILKLLKKKKKAKSMLADYVYLLIDPNQKLLIILRYVCVSCIRKVMLTPKVWIEILMK